ncbi:TPA: EscT/YscT/HrcT family type III secretion system export apparatus protein [Serratia marcescens]
MITIGSLSQEIFLYLISFILCTTRIVVVLFLFQNLTFIVMKGKLKYFVSCAFSLSPAMDLYYQLSSIDVTITFLITTVCKEVIIGFLMGFLFSVPFWIYEGIGSLIDNQSGRLMGEQLTATGGGGTPTGTILKSLCFICILTKIGLAKVIVTIWNSYHFLPVLGKVGHFSPEGFYAFGNWINLAFDYMILYSVPIVGILVLIDVCLGLLNTFSSQLQATQMSIPIKCLVSFLFLSTYILNMNDSFFYKINILDYVKRYLTMLLA